jgi:hypothetical protein
MDTGWILLSSGKVFYIRTNTVSFYTYVFGSCLCSCYLPTILYADLPYRPDDRALRRHIHLIPPQYIER